MIRRQRSSVAGLGGTSRAAFGVQWRARSREIACGLGSNKSQRVPWSSRDNFAASCAVAHLLHMRKIVKFRRETWTSFNKHY